MKPIAVAIQSILGTALLLGCATPGVLAPEVKPLLSIRDGGGGADGYYQLGRYHQVQGRLQQAIVAYRKALALDGRQAEAHNALGTAHATLAEFEIAITEFSAAIAIEPAAPHFHNNLGYALYLSGRNAEAVLAFEKAVALDASNPRTWNNLGMAAQRLGDASRADEAFSRAQVFAAAPPSPSTPAVAAAAPAAPAPSEIEPRLADALPRPPARTASGQIATSPVPAVATVLSPTTVVAVPAAVAPVAEESASAKLEPLVPTELQSVAAPPLAAFTPELPVVPMERVAEALPTSRLDPIAATELKVDPIWSPSAGMTALVSVPEVHFVEMAPAMIDASSPSVASSSVASVSEPIVLGQLDASPAIVALPPANAGAPAESIVVEVPAALESVSKAPGIVDLRWTGTAVVARPAGPESGAYPVSFGLEVANGNGINGMARKLGNVLEAAGLPAARLTNQKPFDRYRTVIYFRDGRRAEAMALSARLPNRPLVMPSTGLRSGIDVRLVLGRDLPPDVALVTPTTGAIRTGDASAASSRRKN